MTTFKKINNLQRFILLCYKCKQKNFTTLMQLSLRYNKIAVANIYISRFWKIMSNEKNTQLEVSPVQEDSNLTPQEARQKRIEISQQLLQKLAEEFPTIFPKPKDGRPVALAIGIHKQLIPVVTEWGFSAVNLRSALSWYTKQLRYQQAVVHAPHRTNLDGTEAEIIDDEHRTLARENVEKIQSILEKKNPERAKKRAEKRTETATKSRKPKAPRANNAASPKKAAEKVVEKETQSLDQKMQSLLNKFNQ